MPHVARLTPVRIAAPLDRVRAAAAALPGASADGDAVTVPVPGSPDPAVRARLVVRRAGAHGHDDGDGTTSVVVVERVGRLRLPYFGWVFAPLVDIAQARAGRHAAASVAAACEGRVPPPPARPVVGLPPVPFSSEQATFLATAALAVAIVTFGSGLFGQLADPIGDSFGASDARLGVALAVTRAGALVALVVTALADRRGRRRAVLAGVAGAAISAGLSAIAPTLELFTAAQTLQRACVIITATVAGIAAIEEAPEGARAYAASMLALAGGFGFSFAVLSLPLADLGTDAWRIPYAVGAGALLLTPTIARRLRETTRYEALVARIDVARGSLRELLDRRYGPRFAVLAVVGFLTGVFNAPSSQLMNKYLTDVRDFSNTGIALFRAVTTAVPGLVGLLLAGRLAESHGRKPVAIVSLAIATGTQMLFFLRGGATLWIAAAASVLTASTGGLALGTLDAELFPTELRATANALLVIVGVLGSSSGLVIAGALSEPLGGIGRSIALCGLAGLLAVVFIPRLPETGSRLLDDVSPTEPRRVYRPPDG
jgi:MFS family permease